MLAFALGGVALIGAAAERRLSGEGAVAPGGGRDGAMVVGGRDPGGRDLHQRLPAAGAGPRAGAGGRGRSPRGFPCHGINKRRRSRWRCVRCCSGWSIGRARLPIPAGARSSPTVIETLSTALWPILAGGVLAILLGRWRGWPPRVPLRGFATAIIGPARRAALAVGEALERIDVVFRQWPAAGLSLLLLAITFGAAMLAAH